MSTTAPGPTLRERKKLDTHRALSTAAIRLVAERGLDQVTVEDISAEAGVSARTFFNYFASKEDAVVIPYPDQEERALRTVERLLAAPAELDPVHALLFAFLDEMRRLDENRDEWLTRISIIEANPALISRMITAGAANEKQLVEAIALRTGLDARKDFYPALVLSVISGAVGAAVRHWSLRNGELPFTELLEQAVSEVAGGLRAPDTGH